MSSSSDGQVLFWEAQHGMPEQCSYSGLQAKNFLRTSQFEEGLNLDWDVEVNGNNQHFGSHEGALIPARQAMNDEQHFAYLLQQNSFDVNTPLSDWPTDLPDGGKGFPATEELPPMLSEVAKFLDETTFVSDRTCSAFTGLPPPCPRSAKALASAVAQRPMQQTVVMLANTAGERQQSETDVDEALVSAYEMISEMKEALTAAYEVISEKDEALVAAQTTLLEKDEELKVAFQGNHEATPESQNRRSLSTMFRKRSKQQQTKNKHS